MCFQLDSAGVNTYSTALSVITNMQVKFPVFQDLPRLPTPFGALLYPEVCLE